MPVPVIYMNSLEKTAFRKIIDTIESGQMIDTRFAMQNLNISREMLDRLQELGVIEIENISTSLGFYIERITLDKQVKTV